jgi:hypothetical protein
MGFAIITALTLSSLTALSRAGLVLVLISDKAADEVLPSLPQPDQAPIRLARLRAAAVLSLCGAVPAAALIDTAQANHAISPEHEITITAHRAGSGRAPENTMAALRAAIADGADAVEIDVQKRPTGKSLCCTTVLASPFAQSRYYGLPGWCIMTGVLSSYWLDCSCSTSIKDASPPWFSTC